MSKAKDMSEAEFMRACKRHGFSFNGAMPGYVKIAEHDKGGGYFVYRFNAGERRRDQLAYLIAEAKKVSL